MYNQSGKGKRRGEARVRRAEGRERGKRKKVIYALKHMQHNSCRLSGRINTPLTLVRGKPQAQGCDL